MAKSWQTEIAAAGQSTVSVNISYLQRADLFLSIDGAAVTDFVWASDILIQLANPLSGGETILLVRKTERNSLRIQFSEGAAFDRSNLDEQNTQFLYLAQELVEGRSFDGFYGNLSMNGYRITDLGAPVNPQDAVNKAYADTVLDAVSGQVAVAQAAAVAAQDEADRANMEAEFATEEADRAKSEADRAKSEADRAAAANPDNSLLKVNNLSDLTDKPQARTNLDVYSKSEVYSKGEVDSDVLQLANSIEQVNTRVNTLIQYQLLYPNGSAAAPATIGVNTRLVVTNPYPGKRVIAVVETLVNSIWGPPGFTYISTNGAYGVSASQINETGDIVIQSANTGVSTSAVWTGNPQGATGSLTTVQYRLKLYCLA